LPFVLFGEGVFLRPVTFFIHVHFHGQLARDVSALMKEPTGGAVSDTFTGEPAAIPRQGTTSGL
jgi:hypothetical protein